MKRTRNAIRNRSSQLGFAVTETKNAWTEYEDQIIKNNYANNGWKGCAKLLPGRSISSIMMRANFFGVAHANKDKNKCWTKEEDDVIRQYYPIEGKEVYKRLIGRTAQLCANRAGILKIYVYKYSLTAADKEIISNYYYSEGRWCFKRLCIEAQQMLNDYNLKNILSTLLLKQNNKIYCPEIDMYFDTLDKGYNFFKTYKFKGKYDKDIYKVISKKYIFKVLIGELSDIKGLHFIYVQTRN